MSKKEIFIEDIIEKILNGNNVHEDLNKLRNLIQYKRSFDNDTLSSIYNSFGTHCAAVQTHVDGLPYPVATLVNNANQQSNVLIQVLFLCDAVECFARWRLSEMLAIIHSENGCIPDNALGDISDKITRPSMGSWISGFKHLADQIQDKKTWLPKNFNQDIDALFFIGKNRNKLAHGDIAGNAQEYFDKIHPKADAIFKNYADLGIAHFATHDSKIYLATGVRLKTTPKHTSSIYALDSRETFYGFQKKNTCLQIPITFRIFKKETPAQDPDLPFYTGSFISTHGKCNSANAGGSLEYTLVDGEGLQKHKDLQDFISLFKIGKGTLSNEPWKGLIDEISNSNVWDLDRDLLKLRREGYCAIHVTTNRDAPDKTEIELLNELRHQTSELGSDRLDGKLWYYGGPAQHGKSTLLYSWLKNQNQRNTFVFPHRFEGIALDDSLDDFFRTLRNALIYWLRESNDLPSPDLDLTGAYLQKDTESFLKDFLNSASKPTLIIALDDIHNLFNPQKKEQQQVEVLIDFLKRCGHFTKEESKKRGKTEYQAQVQHQVFAIATGLDVDYDTDIDSYFKGHHDVEFVYTLSSTRAMTQDQFEKIRAQLATDIEDDARTILLQPIVDYFKHPDYPNAPKFNINDTALERVYEVIEHFVDPSDGNPRGAHLPPLKDYGAKKILNDGALNPQLIQTLQQTSGRGRQYIRDLLKLADHKPAIIEAVGENLSNGNITIDTPLTPACYNTIIPTDDNPFLQDTSRLIPLIIVYLKYAQEHFNGQPLTVTTLEILCGIDYQSQPNNNKYILEALYSIPRLVKRIALEEAEINGDLAFGWILRRTIQTHEDPEFGSLFNPTGGLSLTEKLAESRIAQITKNIHILSDTLQLKSILLKRIPPQLSTASKTQKEKNPNQNSPMASVQDLFQQLQGAINYKIQKVGQNNSNNSVLRAALPMIQDTCSIASAQTTWLQKAWESKDLQTEALEFAEGPSFNEFWLKHINAEHHPIFDHKQTSILCPENISQITPINDDYCVLLTKDYSSIFLHNIRRSTPDITLFQGQADKQTKACIVTAVTSTDFIIVYNIKNIVHIKKIAFGPKLKEECTQSHDFTGDVTHICHVSDSEIAIFGEHPNNAIDILSNLNGSIKTITLSSGQKSPPKYVLEHNRKTYAFYGSNIFEVTVSGLSEAFNLAATPQLDPYTTQNGLLSIGGSSNSKRKHSWYSTTEQSVTDLQDSNSSKQFSKIVFAENISNNRLITVDQKGTLRIYDWGSPTPALERELNVPETVKAHRTGLNGGLIKDERLLLYGAPSYMEFFEIDIKKDTSQSTIQNLFQPHLHYGNVKDASFVSGTYFGHSSLFVTISEDNDARLWSFTAGSIQEPTAACIGLFRGHEGKLLTFTIHNDTLITADDKQNALTWKISEGCRKQLDTLGARNPNFIQKALWHKDSAWVVSSASSNIHIEEYPNHGQGWSQQKAISNQNTPTFSDIGNITSTIHFDRYIVILETQKLHIFDLDNKSIVKLEDIQDIKVKGLDHTEDGILLYTKTDIYLLDRKLSLMHIITATENEEIDVVVLDKSQAHMCHYSVSETESITEKGKTKVKTSDTRHIYKCELAAKQSSLIFTLQSTAQIKGLYHSNGDILFWVEHKPNPLGLFLYHQATNQIMTVPEHNLLKNGLKNIYRRPLGEAFCFQSGDNDRRWTLAYDRRTQQLELRFYTDWIHASENLSELVNGFQSEKNVVSDLNLFSESTYQGILLHYSNDLSERAQRLMWTGESLRDFKVCQILDLASGGRIIVKKNRSLIVLQLMKGNVPQPFKALMT